MMKEEKWQRHPRPQRMRKEYQVLQGEWTVNGNKIVVPFPPQSRLSRYEGSVPEQLIYRHSFCVPEKLKADRILLHFDAVDQIARVLLNGKDIGVHEGGYLPFSFDVTEQIQWDTENNLEVQVTDTLSPVYPYGKQCKNPHGMWYTPVSGIWQPVWIEGVPDCYVEELRIKADLEKVYIEVDCNKPIDKFEAEIQLPDGRTLYKEWTGKNIEIQIPEPELWSTEHPYLYRMKVKAGEDCIDSYFAMRTIEIIEIDGISRVCLNKKPIFLHGVLDQGYFQQGIYLPENEREYEKDVLRMKELGFNMLRKHIKIEPEYFYYACDKLGMLVMQDMVNNGAYSFWKDTLLPTLGFKKRNDTKMSVPKEIKDSFEKHMKETILHLYNHPCVIAYTIFNEGWGQFDSDAMYEKAKALDLDRLIDTTSGWYAQQKSDFDSEHIYFRLKKLKMKKRPKLLSECGGFKYLDKDHFQGCKEYGYGSCANSEELTKRIVNMYEKMVLPYIGQGLCGCVYTQLSDVEGEINGLYTYDRVVCKVEKEQMKDLSERIIQKIENI